MKIQKKIREFSAVLILLVTVLSLIGVRADLVDTKVGSYSGCEGCFNLSVLKADLLIVYITIGILLVAGLFRSSIPRRVLHLGFGLVLLFYIADLFVFKLFNFRLFFADIMLYFEEWTVVWEQFSSGLGGDWTAFLAVAAVIALFLALFFMPAIRGPHARIVLLATLTVALFTDVLIDSPIYVNSWATDNVFQLNLGTSERTEYSSDFVAKVTESQPTERKIWSPLPAQSGRNVIMVILESWSSWHSKGFGGIYDWTPQLDAAARRGRSFSNFHGIGFATVNGLVGILAGQNIWSPFLPLLERTPFHSQWGNERTLPSVFSKHGYKTAFLTTGPLTLYRKGEWMQDIGFGHVEGGEHPTYANEKRFAFDSPSDSALYRRALEWMQAERDPYFLVLETVTTHQPYTDPVSGERSLEKAMRFADQAFGEFLQRLNDVNFFDRGLLLVVSDHRSMTPVFAEEIDQFGPAAISQVPAFFMGNEFVSQTVDDRVFSQADLLPTMELWLSGSVEVSPQDGIMFGDFETSKCAFHERGDRRGYMLATCPEGSGEVYLDGDNTRFVESAGLSEGREDSLLMTIARERIKGMLRHRAVESESATDQVDH